MKKLITSATVIAIAGCFACLTETASAQGTASTNAKSVEHKVGLIDMAHVFKNYTKFTALREELKAEIQQSDAKAKAMAEKIQAVQKEMQDFKQGSPEYLAREKQLAQAASDFEAFRKVAQRDFLRKESRIYHTIYMEVTDTVKKYAKIYNYTLIMRFNRENLDTDDPKKLIQGMNRQVVYHRADDDITLSVLDYLNRSYKPSSGGSSAAPTRSTTRPTPGTTNR
ncbi:OmpH family outer membrane protein [Gimesia fumaroli]|uniref:Outer membrane protein (OmpH-like) n=1 Tax=Gimesia fumaroli TaxID=2527976 RepID=A0A518I6S2_9PLAN|nr:OmpH family outer membrane protein [Gimesia fumaroli]QDV48769.1 Outer membrane protein (OmpH-like) [Gimesia fumaroli]